MLGPVADVEAAFRRLLLLGSGGQARLRRQTAGGRQWLAATGQRAGPVEQLAAAAVAVAGCRDGRGGTDDANTDGSPSDEQGDDGCWCPWLQAPRRKAAFRRLLLLGTGRGCHARQG
jgi:hypothetical protein